MKYKLIVILTLILSLNAYCQNDRPSYSLIEVSDDPSYGYTKENPVKVGHGPAGERYYLSQLTGKKGGKIKYIRLGSCCAFKTDSPTAFSGHGLLDKYEIKGKGNKKTIVYLNMYDFEKPKAIMNYSIRE